MNPIAKTLQNIAVIIGDELSCDPGLVEVSTTAEDIDGWDSLAHARLIMRIEEDFGVRFPGHRLFDLDNVGDIVSLVEECLAAEGRVNAH